MFYESRLTKTQWNETWKPIAEAFREDELKEAMAALSESSKPEDPEQILLLSDLLKAAGAYQDSFDVVKEGRESFPESGRIALLFAHRLSGRGRVLKALRVLDEVDTDALSESDRELASALRLCALARMERGPSAREIMKDIVLAGGPKNPMSAFLMAHASMALRNFEAALKLFTLASEKAPRWANARLGRHHCLLILNRKKEALAFIEKSVEDLPKNRRMTQTLLSHLCLAEQWSRVAQMSEDILGLVEGESSKLFHAVATRAYARLGDKEKAREHALEVSESWAEKMSALDVTAKRARVEVEPIAQERNMCVAACVASILKSWGEDVDARTIFEEMGGGEGVANWQLDRWLRKRRVFPVDIQFSIEVIRELIDAGFPLLVTRSNVFMGHQELIVGYDDALEEIEALDPMDGLPVHIPYEKLAENYQSCGDTLVALYRVEGSKLSVPSRWCDQEARTKRQVGRWVYEGAIQKAKESFKTLDPEGRHALSLQLEFPGLFGDESSFFELCQEVAEREDLDISIRSRATMSLTNCGEEKRFRAAFKAIKPKLNPFLRSYLAMLQCLSRGNWPRVKRYTEVLLERAAMMPDLWFHAATALKSVGEYQRARECIAICLEIEPAHLGAHAERLRQHDVSIQERRRVVDELLEKHPRSEMLHGLDAQLEVEIGQSLKAEEKLKESIRLLPRSLVPKLRLREYYLKQNRGDLAETVKLPEGSLEDGAPGGDGEAKTSRDESTETLLREAWTVLTEKDGVPNLTVLENRHIAKRLSLEESLELQQIKILGQRKAKDFNQFVFEQCLPKALPLPRAGYLSSFLGSLIDHGVNRREAQVLILWAQKMMEGFEWTPFARFYCAILKEAAGHDDVAEREFEELAEEGMAEASFSLGLIAVEKEHYKRARKHFQNCIAKKPAHFGSWLNLAKISAIESEFSLAKSCLERMILLRPYDPSVVETHLNFLGSLKQPNAKKQAMRWLRENYARYPKALMETWKAEFLLNRGDFQEALDAIGDGMRNNAPRDALAFEITCLKAMRRHKEYAPLIDEALKSYPDDPYFLHLKIMRTLSKPKECFKMARKLFVKNPNPQTLGDIILLRRLNLAETMTELFNALDVSKREAMLEMVTGAMIREHTPAYAQWLIAIESMHPSSLPIVEKQLLLSLSVDRWFTFESRATRYLDLGGKDAQILNMCGSILMRSRPALARRAFARQFNSTKWPEALCLVAHCDVRLGQKERALKTLWNYLGKQPQCPEVIGALAVIGEDPARLIESVLETIKRAPITSAKEFAMAAVQVAAVCRRSLSERWQDWAVTRARALAKNEKPIPESESLQAMLEIWSKVRGDKKLMDEVYGRMRRSPRLESRSRLPWQKRSEWVPRRKALAPLKAKLVASPQRAKAAGPRKYRPR